MRDYGVAVGRVRRSDFACQEIADGFAPRNANGVPERDKVERGAQGVGEAEG